ncbi:MAG: EamA family transporter [Thermoproteus sp.]
MYGPLPALAAALIWAYASVSYRDYVERLGVYKLNSLRMLYASAALLAPALYLGLGREAVYAVLSGVLSLALGDSLYLKALRSAGVSIAVPAAYSYVILEQFIAVPLGEPLRASYLLAAGLVVAGVYLLVAGQGRGNLVGVLYALGAALAWSAGYAAVKVAGVGGLSPISIAFVRVASALPILASLSGPREVSSGLRSTWRTSLPIIAVLDLGGGSALFAYSTVEAGLGLTVIVLGVVPLASQLMSRALGKERPTAREYSAAALILSAIAISFI